MTSIATPLVNDNCEIFSLAMFYLTFNPSSTAVIIAFLGCYLSRITRAAAGSGWMVSMLGVPIWYDSYLTCLISCHLWEVINRDIPVMADQIRQGRFDTQRV